MKFNCRLFTILTAVILLAIGCSEEIDVSNRYVFKEETLVSYMEKHAETYSEYLDVLKNTPVSEMSNSTIYQLLTARGNYTVFAPTNDAVHQYLQELVEEDIITEPSWEAFTKERVRDSIRKVIAYSSIIIRLIAIRYNTFRVRHQPVFFFKVLIFPNLDISIFNFLYLML